MFNKVVCREHIIAIIHIKESRVTYMAESVYTNETQKFDLILTTIEDIEVLNTRHIHHIGFDEYLHYIASASRSCNLGIDSWSNICMYSINACNLWDILKAKQTNEFLKLRKYDPLHLKLAALRIMLDNFKSGDDDTRPWKLANNKLEIISPPTQNPVHPNPPEDSDYRMPNFPLNNPNEHFPYPDETGNPPISALLRQLEYYI